MHYEVRQRTDTSNMKEPSDWNINLKGYTPAPLTSKTDKQYELTLVHSSELSPLRRREISEIYWANMTNLVTGTTLFSPSKEKDEELFDEEQWYLLVKSGSTAVQCEIPPEIAPSLLEAYAGLRIIEEDTTKSMNSGYDEDKIPVIYIYEMQVSSRAQGAGLGRSLMNEVELLTQRAGLTKIVLTCLKGNVQGLRFYQKFGYAPDEIDPTYSYRVSLQKRLLRSRGKKATKASLTVNEIDKAWMDGDTEGNDTADYRILSKEVKQA